MNVVGIEIRAVEGKVDWEKLVDDIVSFSLGFWLTSFIIFEIGVNVNWKAQITVWVVVVLVWAYRRREE